MGILATWRNLLRSSSHTAAPGCTLIYDDPNDDDYADDNDGDDDLCALIDHEADAISESVAGSSHLPARIDHVDLRLDLPSTCHQHQDNHFDRAVMMMVAFSSDLYHCVIDFKAAVQQWSRVMLRLFQW